ncbi:MAG: ecotin family protein [Synechococcus sp.]|nr:ecotin family protein [Synechococcus sp.]
MRPSFVLPALALAGSAGLASLLAPAGAIPRFDAAAYPAAAAGERRWVIQLPGVLPPTADPALSSQPNDWRVQLIVGRSLLLDCNRHSLAGKLVTETLPGSGLPILRVQGAGAVLSTRMACPPEPPPRQGFVPLGGGKPFVVPYNASRPIVIYAPDDLEVRWRLWKAEKRQQAAQPF